MLAIDSLIIVGAVLVLFAIFSSKISTRIGVPTLVVFIALGMLAGSEGLGIDFENYALSGAIGTVALSLILFDGGLRTSTRSLRTAWRPAFLLATVGVVLTALVTGVAASQLLGVTLLQGMLLGSIVGSTDAAAVFSVLSSKGARLPERLNATLEVESGSNDPMAVLLTIGLIEVLLGRLEPGPGLVSFFLVQMGLGLGTGLLVGWLGSKANNRINLEAAGLYPIMLASVGLLAYGLAAAAGGSGFLAVYVAGIVLGNSPLVFRRGILLFMDGTAWLSQIVMFTMLGLLSFPSRLMEVAPVGLAIAAVLIFVSRPLAVIPLLLPFRFNAREIAVVAWGGLRGAVPIILATFPLIRGVPEGHALFDVVFFVVLVSAITQGWSLPWLARRLGLQRPLEPAAPVSLEITSLRQVDGDIVEYSVVEGTRAGGRRIRELALPEGAVVAMITRGSEVIPPRGSTQILVGDHLFVVVRHEVRALVDRVFSPQSAPTVDDLTEIDFPLSPKMLVTQLTEFYGIDVDAPPDCTLEDLLRKHLHGQEIAMGSSVRLGKVVLTVREVSETGIEHIGLQLEA